jgi:hypothetical protein
MKLKGQHFESVWHPKLYKLSQNFFYLVQELSNRPLCLYLEEIAVFVRVQAEDRAARFLCKVRTQYGYYQQLRFYISWQDNPWGCRQSRQYFFRMFLLLFHTHYMFRFLQAIFRWIYTCQFLGAIDKYIFHLKMIDYFVEIGIFSFVSFCYYLFLFVLI